MGKYEQNLIANAIPLMEVDDEEFDLDSAEVNSDIIDLVDTFGNEEFKEIYQNLYDVLFLLTLIFYPSIVP